MARNRKFDELTEKEKVRRLVGSLMMAAMEPDDVKRTWRANVYSIARQYANRNIVRLSDYDMVKKMTIEEVVTILMKKDEL